VIPLNVLDQTKSSGLKKQNPRSGADRGLDFSGGDPKVGADFRYQARQWLNQYPK
jgi:hypothetical protein